MLTECALGGFSNPASFFRDKIKHMSLNDRLEAIKKIDLICPAQARAEELTNEINLSPEFRERYSRVRDIPSGNAALVEWNHELATLEETVEQYRALISLTERQIEKALTGSQHSELLRQTLILSLNR